MNNKKPNIIILDIETSPLLSYNWGMFEQNAIDIKEEWYILSIAVKNLNEKKTYCYALPDFKLYKQNKTNDLELIKKIYEIIDDADIIIGHNLDSFDMKKINSRIIYHGLLPPSSYKTIDTLKIAKKYFKFTSNSLNNLCKHFKIGKKLKHEGFDLWLGCMNGNKKSWTIMKKYNKIDVIINEKLYNKFKPFITNHPNVGLYQGKEFACPNCGCAKLTKNGLRATKVQMYQRWRCNSCGACSQSVKSEKINKIQLKN